VSDPIADPASLPSGAPDNASSTDTQSGDDLLKVMAELHAALERAGQQSDTDAGNPSPVLMSTDGADSSELSEELLALSSKEATDLAIQYLLSADQADHGRTAFLLLDRASTAGDGRAMYFLFLCYLKGIGHPEDRAEALHWLQQSAESGDAIGMYAYSTAIRLGDYEGLDESDAVMWLNRSASVGHQPAINELERMRVAGALEALLSGMGANDDAEAPDYACAGAYGFFEHCPCEGFRPGGGTSQDPDPFLCKSCGHSMQDHYR
jgi:TPR repeat protein